MISFFLLLLLLTEQGLTINGLFSFTFKNLSINLRN